MRPLVVNTTDSDADDVPLIRTDTVVPTASAICEARVRCQISSYRRNSSAESWPANDPGVRNVSPDGRIASWASWAFFTLRE